MLSLKKREVKIELKDKESQIEKNKKEKQIDLELHKFKMMTNMEQLLKEFHKREEKFFKLLIGTWAVIVECILFMLLKMT